jgi:serine/threonine-protein kinase
MTTTHQDVSTAAPKIRRRAVHRPITQPLFLEGWELLEHVADGAYASVYRARPADRCIPSPAAYAVKVLREPWCDRPEIVELLRSEAHAARLVCHPHLISVLATGTTEKPYFLVSPWLTGQTLSRILESHGSIDLPTVLWIARQAAEALRALEHAGWMHGDVKPGNMIVSPEAHVTLIDLGFARPLGESGSVVDRPVMGTYQYIAPEMVTSRLASDIRSDIYSLGVVLFQMLSGRLPFEGQTLAELAEQHRNWRPPDLRRLVPTLPGGLTRLVREMLSKNPWRRPRHAQEVVERLSELEIASFGQRSSA